MSVNKFTPSCCCGTAELPDCSQCDVQPPDELDVDISFTWKWKDAYDGIPSLQCADCTSYDIDDTYTLARTVYSGAHPEDSHALDDGNTCWYWLEGLDAPPVCSRAAGTLDYTTSWIALNSYTVGEIVNYINPSDDGGNGVYECLLDHTADNTNKPNLTVGSYWAYLRPVSTTDPGDPGYPISKVAIRVAVTKFYASAELLMYVGTAIQGHYAGSGAHYPGDCTGTRVLNISYGTEYISSGTPCDYSGTPQITVYLP